LTSKLILPLTSLVFGLFLSLLIFAYFIFYFDSGENVAVENEILYSEVASSFFTDYDKENPLTKR
jgi:hypothetical protein